MWLPAFHRSPRSVCNIGTSCTSQNIWPWHEDPVHHFPLHISELKAYHHAVNTPHVQRYALNTRFFLDDNINCTNTRRPP